MSRVRARQEGDQCTPGEIQDADYDRKFALGNRRNTEASACRYALDLAEYTRAMLCKVAIGGRVLPDEWREEQMPIRAITD